jgi:NAD(P)-dependent dehydrogenase (short-subunit alcohol dehydrogenase family)
VSCAFSCAANAGNAHGLDPIQTGDVDDWDAMIDINVVSKAIIPQMIERKSGHHQYWLYCCKGSIQMEMYIAPQNTL